MSLSQTKSSRKNKNAEDALLQHPPLKKNEERRVLRRLKRQKRQARQEMQRIQEKELKVKRTGAKRNRIIQRKLDREKDRIRHLSKTYTDWLSPDRINSIARITGYIKNPNAKIPPLPFLITLAYGMFGNGSATYIILAANMATWFNISITAQALFGRISRRETVHFLKSALVEAMSNQLLNGFKNHYASLFGAFTSVHLEDSTQFELNASVAKGFKGSGGSASKSAMKLNIAYEITRHVISSCEITSGATPDQSLSKKILKVLAAGSLIIRDLGYFNIVDLHSIHKLKAFFLSRLKIGVTVYENNDDIAPMSINTFLENATQDGGSFDKDVYIGESRLSVRMIGEKVPEFVKQKRLESYKKNKIKRDGSKKMSENYVTWIGYSIFVTNIPAQMLVSARLIMAVYRIRWQIELFFKRMKSILEVHIIKGASQNRVYCLIYSKLISLLMAQSIISYATSLCLDDEEVSEYKLMTWLKENNRLGCAMMDIETLEGLLEDLIRSNYLLCKNKRKKSKSTFRQLKKAFEDSSSDWIPLENVA